MARIRRLGPAVRIGLIAGVLVAALAFPLAALAGIGIVDTGRGLNGIPTELTVSPPAQTSYVYAADGRTLLTAFYEENRHDVPLDAVAQDMQHAIIAAEDARFYQHHGVDARGVARAFVANQKSGGVSQGGSTLTMQYVRLALQNSARTPAEITAATQQTAPRKAREMRLAIELEKHTSKAEILSRYLNAAYFGHRAYGIYAASQVFFSKPPSDLTIAESATLAGLVKAPTDFDPASQDQGPARDRRNYIIDKMAELKYISPAQADQAKREPIRLRLSSPPNDCVSIPGGLRDYGYFCDIFRNWWLRQPAFGKNSLEREEQLRRGGYRVVTSIDAKAQAAATAAVQRQQASDSNLAMGVVVVEPGTGRIRAAALNRVYSLEPGRANTVNPLLGGGDIPGYQAGSTFKMFTMLAALEHGMPLSTSYNSPMQYRSKYRIGWGQYNTCGSYWCPKNASKEMTGDRNMWSGFGESVNTYFVQLEEKVGADNAVKMAERLGLRWRTDVDSRLAEPRHAKNWGSFTLGVSSTTPLEMANAYAAVAADGRYCAATPVVSITGPDGRPVSAGQPQCQQVVSSGVARAATDAARCVTGYGAAAGGCGSWSTGTGIYRAVGRPVAGKTGTTDNDRSAWFVGYTPDLAAAGFIADPDNPNSTVGGATEAPGVAVAETLRGASAGTPAHDFKPPPGRLVSR
ncbi:transglycosylase domain-containing protein [Rhizomonospora bruguierae]|uniref:transglycosylase domain-containing protein n=1 Tax=Rhizomonospora bruguierae TaxID=1581705 RepID=UPI001BD148F2|nr:transglycosylase domain-containing protein [Micromonospora sp. NBRC 107566]